MKFKFNPRHTSIAVYCVIVFAVCLLLVALVFKYSTFIEYGKKIISVLSPIIWGICIAYILNPFMTFCERHFKKWFCKKKPKPSLTRTMAITVSFIAFLGAIAALIIAIIPEIKNTITDFFKTLPIYLKNLQYYTTNIINSIVKWKPELAEFFDIEFNNIQDIILQGAQKLEPMFNEIFESSGNLIETLTDSAWAFIMGFKDCVLGIFVSIYLLYNKETYLAQATKITYMLFPERPRNIILKVASKTNETFIHYFTGMAIDSLAIGVITFIALNIMGLDSFAVLISIILGVTNMIPVFGPFIGAVPSTFLILLTYPNKTIIFIVFVLILQQIDGNIIAPKILGNTLGLSPFWIIFAIFLGGGLFGFVGIIVFVPVFAVVYSIIKEIVENGLKRKELPVSTNNYRHERTEPIIQLDRITLPRFIKKLLRRLKYARYSSKNKKE